MTKTEMYQSATDRQEIQRKLLAFDWFQDGESVTAQQLAELFDINTNQAGHALRELSALPIGHANHVWENDRGPSLTYRKKLISHFCAAWRTFPNSELALEPRLGAL